MKFSPAQIEGVWVIDFDPIADERGWLCRLYDRQAFLDHGIAMPIPQINMVYNERRGVLRGMHYQIEPYGEDKLIQCVSGAVFDVIVDLRPGSSTRGRWFGVELSAQCGRALFAPRGCAHGYVTLTDGASLYYLMGAVYAPESARGVRWNDPKFSIAWPLEPTVVSDRDRAWPDWDA